MRFGKGGIEYDDPVISRERLKRPLKPFQEYCAIEVRFDEIGHQREGALGGGKAFGQTAEVHQDRGARTVKVGIFRRQHSGCITGSERRRQLLQDAQARRAVVQSGGVARIQGETARISHNGAGMIARRRKGVSLIENGR